MDGPNHYCGSHGLPSGDVDLADRYLHSGERRVMRGICDDDVDASAYDVHRFRTDGWNDLFLHGFGGHRVWGWCLFERRVRSAGGSSRRSDGCDCYDR